MSSPSSTPTPPSHLIDLIAPLYPPDTQFSLKAPRRSSSAAQESLISPSSPSLSTSSVRYLYKTCPLSQSEQMRGEAESLKVMGNACLELVPKLIGSGELEDEDEFWMLSEWHSELALSCLDMNDLNSDEQQTKLGQLLARMHSPQSIPDGTRFGFHVPTYCGETRQNNEESENWLTFWSENRIGDLIERIGDGELKELGRQIQTRVLPNLLGKLKEVKPSILHGDLWSGNVGYSEDKKSPIIFDPSSYYGHSEAELGMTRMFGGFSSNFYEAYHQVLPKSEPVEDYDTRLDCYELYHHLNHTLMFGASYKSGALRLMRNLIAWADANGYE
ncbi:hypothetical protein JCM3765_007187 [Sporobolomyces pararoseus]